MEIKMFYKTQRELGEVLNKVVDSYWSDEIDENDLIKAIKYLYKNNSSKMVKDKIYNCYKATMWEEKIRSNK
jgi:uncharacterized protein (TIGR04540 family)